MNNFISLRVAVYGTMIILSLVILFHLLVISRVIPYDIVWGGRMQNEEQMVQFESISIIINLMMLSIVLIKGGWIAKQLSTKFINIMLWLMFVLFVLNTIGNLVSVDKMETFIFTPITFLLSLFCFRMAMHKEKLFVA